MTPSFLTPAESMHILDAALAEARAAQAGKPAAPRFNPFALMQQRLQLVQDEREAARRAKIAEYERQQMEWAEDFEWLMKRLGFIAPAATLHAARSVKVEGIRFSMRKKGETQDGQDNRPVLVIGFSYVALSAEKEFALPTETRDDGDYWRITRDDAGYKEEGRAAQWDALATEIALYLHQCGAVLFPVLLDEEKVSAS